MKKNASKMLVVRVERCLGCKSCEIACAVAHSKAGSVEAILRTGEAAFYRLHVEAAGDKAIPIHCNQCEDAACLTVCPTGALHREPGKAPVLANNGRCIGCRMCVHACPFGVIELRRDGKGVLKCDFCVERLATGMLPACVEACPTGAVIFVEDSAVNHAKRRKAAAAKAAAQKK